MTLAWAQRQEALLRDCIVSPDVFNSMVDRLRDFVVPYQHTTWKVIREIWGAQKVLFFEINRLWKRP